MSYESPISTYWGELKTDFDGAVMKAVQRVGIDVDKDELIKALKYDREQYERGYADGLAFRLPIVTNGDRIRNMSDEELARYFGDLSCHKQASREVCIAHERNCEFCWLDWLKQEAECK